jgi:hypothetical protein
MFCIYVEFSNNFTLLLDVIRNALALLGYRRREMQKEKILPTVLIIIDVCAALGYVPCGDYRRVIYWLAAATLTAVVTW